MLAYDITEMQNRLKNGHTVELNINYLFNKQHMDYLGISDSHIQCLRIRAKNS